jgi:hypothetical protein
MKSSVFQYPYDKVLRRTHGVLSKLGLRITDFDKKKGSIKALSNFSFRRPTVKIDLIIEEMENHNTKVSVSGLQVKRHFFQIKDDVENREAEILDAITTVI